MGDTEAPQPEEQEAKKAFMKDWGVCSAPHLSNVKLEVKTHPSTFHPPAPSLHERKSSPSASHYSESKVEADSALNAGEAEPATDEAAPTTESELKVEAATSVEAALP